MPAGGVRYYGRIESPAPAFARIGFNGDNRYFVRAISIFAQSNRLYSLRYYQCRLLPGLRRFFVLNDTIALRRAHATLWRSFLPITIVERR